KSVVLTSLAGVPHTGAMCTVTYSCMAAIRASKFTPIGMVALLKQAIVRSEIGGLDQFGGCSPHRSNVHGNVLLHGCDQSVEIHSHRNGGLIETSNRQIGNRWS